MKAAAQGNPAVVKALLDAGASRGLRNRQGRTALEIARARGHLEAVRLLQEGS